MVLPSSDRYQASSLKVNSVFADTGGLEFMLMKEVLSWADVPLLSMTV